MGLRNRVFPRHRYDLGFSLENIIYFELLRRGYRVNICKVGAAEVDFVAQKQGVLTYFQVTVDMTAEMAWPGARCLKRKEPRCLAIFFRLYSNKNT